MKNFPQLGHTKTEVVRIKYSILFVKHILWEMCF